jgi:hypothetical protein
MYTHLADSFGPRPLLQFYRLRGRLTNGTLIHTPHRAHDQRASRSDGNTTAVIRRPDRESLSTSALGTASHLRRREELPSEIGEQTQSGRALCAAFTDSWRATETYDDFKVQAFLNQIDGKWSDDGLAGATDVAGRAPACLRSSA